ncbi:MAG: hypothetical protein QGI33_05210, partial [Candidatus Brocadiia bacterium]|nr:hypothetical protein [Candidatus Brocadiia bacterium]
WPSAGATNGRRLELLYPAYIDDLGTFDCPAAKGRSPSYDRETKQVLDSDYYLDAWIPAEAGPGRVVLGTSTRTG